MQFPHTNWVWQGTIFVLKPISFEIDDNDGTSGYYVTIVLHHTLIRKKGNMVILYIICFLQKFHGKEQWTSEWSIYYVTDSALWTRCLLMTMNLLHNNIFLIYSFYSCYLIYEYFHICNAFASLLQTNSPPCLRRAPSDRQPLYPLSLFLT